MRKLSQILLIVTASIFSLNVLASEPLPTYSKIFDDTRDPFKDALSAIKLAEQTDRNVLIKIGGNWCSWCKKIDAFWEANPDIKTQLHSTFVLLKVNVSDSNENQAFMKGLPPVMGYPHMYVSTNNGKVILSKDTAEFLKADDSGEYSRAQWLAFIDEWQLANNSDNIARSTNNQSANANSATASNNP